MPDTKIDTDVLIVGAGPVDLFLANECHRRGLRYRIVAARAAQSEHSKALAISPHARSVYTSIRRYSLAGLTLELSGGGAVRFERVVRYP